MPDTRDPKNRTASANFVLQGRALARLYALTDPNGALRAVITARTLPEAMEQARATHRLTRQWRLQTCTVTWAAPTEPAATGAEARWIADTEAGVYDDAPREGGNLPSPKLRYAKDKDGLRHLHKLGDVWLIYVNEGDIGNLHLAGIAEEVTAPREGGEG